MDYFSKILLFGEHTIVNGGKALAAPLLTYQAQWQYHPDSASATDSNNTLYRFADHLNSLQEQGALRFELDFSALYQQLHQGLYLESDIPVGYGIGSSGAVCAAIYDRFGIKEEIPMVQLQAIFAQLESYFHGASSGVDPLICFLQKAVLFYGKKQFSTIQLPSLPDHLTFFLLDTRIPRSTGPLVKYFQEKLQEDEFAQAVADYLIPANEQAIEAYQQTNFDQLWIAFQQISAFQLKYQRQMIPEAFWPIWELGLNSSSFKLKICGAGGGGFILGLSSDFSTCQAALKERGMEAIPFTIT